MENKLVVNSLYTDRDDEGYIYYKGKLFTGVEKWYRENGELGTTTEYINGIPDGLMTGWYPNGNKRSEKAYKKGCVEGKSIQWYENGMKKIEKEIYDGKEVRMREWDEQGNLIVDK